MKSSRAFQKMPLILPHKVKPSSHISLICSSVNSNNEHICNTDGERRSKVVLSLNSTLICLRIFTSHLQMMSLGRSLNIFDSSTKSAPHTPLDTLRRSSIGNGSRPGREELTLDKRLFVNGFHRHPNDHKNIDLQRLSDSSIGFVRYSGFHDYF